MPDNLDSAPRAVFTVKQFAARHPAFPMGALRDYIFKARDRTNSRGERVAGNGLAASGAILRLGRKLLISEPHFFAWLVAQQHKHHAKAERAKQRQQLAHSEAT